MPKRHFCSAGAFAQKAPSSTADETAGKDRGPARQRRRPARGHPADRLQPRCPRRDRPGGGERPSALRRPLRHRRHRRRCQPAPGFGAVRSAAPCRSRCTCPTSPATSARSVRARGRQRRVCLRTQVLFGAGQAAPVPLSAVPGADPAMRFSLFLFSVGNVPIAARNDWGARCAIRRLPRMRSASPAA